MVHMEAKATVLEPGSSGRKIGALLRFQHMRNRADIAPQSPSLSGPADAPAHAPRRPAEDSLARLQTRASTAKAQAHQWKRAYRRRLLIVDFVVLMATVTAADVLSRIIREDGLADAWGWNQHTQLSIVLVILWMTALVMMRSHEISLVGIGAEEYRRVVMATAWVFGLIAVAVLFLETSVSRTHLGIALALGLISLIFGRRLLRSDLARRRRRGDYITRVLVLGKVEPARVLCESFARSPDAGYRVVGLCVPDFDGEYGQEIELPTGIVPILGDDSAVKSALRFAGADALAVAAAEHLGHRNMRKLIWRMQSMNTELIVVPGVTDVAGHRLRMRPIDNLPLFHIEAPPQQDSPSMFAKRLLDVTLGTVLLIAALPIMLLAGLAIKIEDRGPILFSQERVGLGNNRFRIYKLRSMTVENDAADEFGHGHCGIFHRKSAPDHPRITRVGKWLRRHSVDELPQLINVLGGSMSLVGPRPLVVGEAESVEHFLARRALVKPGMTGMWQISGRSDLTDEERVRLDHFYVDNWSVTQDLMIIWRTVRAVLKGDGAY
jgi:exopolysaccharide biosynthesis polyprenyl glycosylphosphotransferase